MTQETPDLVERVKRALLECRVQMREQRNRALAFKGLWPDNTFVPSDEDYAKAVIASLSSPSSGERAQIVAELRRRADAGKPKPEDWPERDWQFWWRGGYNALHAAADAIERGDHLASPAQIVAGEELLDAFARTQWMLETIARSNSTNFTEVHERIIANRKVLASLTKESQDHD